MWYGILAPKGTPADFVARVNAELKSILDSAEVRSAFETQGMTPQHSGADDFRRLIEKDAARWEKVIKTQGIRAD